MKSGKNMGLRSFIAKRVAYSFLLIFLVCTLNFVIFILMPGDPVGMFVGGIRGLSREDKEMLIQRMKERLGIGDPTHIQYLKYIKNMFTWNLGESMQTRKSVADALVYRIPFTIYLMGGSTALAVIIGVVFGVLVAAKRGGKFDGSMVFTSLVLYSLPTFWMGMIFISIFFSNLGWFPSAHAYPPQWNRLAADGSGNMWPRPFTLTSNGSTQASNLVLAVNTNELMTLAGGFFTHGFLPLATLTLFLYGGYLLLTRATMLDALTEDYIVTARAKGLSETNILFRQALKNASLPLITSVAIAFGFMLSGAIITESVYSWPGLGGWIWQAIQQQDYYVLQAFFYIIALCVIAANFVADLIYGVIDPRIKYG
mgnify:CR=1 FL=1